MDEDDVEARLEAVERALADGETDLAAVAEAAERERELDELRGRVDDLESQLTDLAASVQAVRGYVGNVRTVNRDVERRADTALAKVEELERHGTDRNRRYPHDDADETGQHDGQSRVDGRDDDSPESPGDIARRITGRDESKQERRPPCDGSGRGGVRRQPDRSERRAHPRDRSDTATGPGRHDDDENGGGFLSDLRDAL
ncbi:DUF7310 family coiled-coil domain-containing protein [Halorientalis regularis]|jgi:chromosome segregation ATPase|uniref:DUF7310 domain-containing protein n=1 Tax=Halorientalis regularis TaxID=660518 RepID=A0A1G7IW73_9EURY|nr:hypothetical protein [Halorientalis regularis]SDF16559.1 hypothetical protein SAMN05216218_10496 [Halorientalis regularis]